MAWSSSFATDNQYIVYQIGITQNSQNIENNTSNVTVQVRVHRTNTGYTTQGTGTVYCTINGTKYSASITSSQTITSSWRTIFTKTLNISHSSDGSKTLSTSAYINHSRFDSSSHSYSQTLTKIPRATTPTFNSSSVEIGQTVQISLPRATSSFTHNVSYSLGTESGTIAEGVGTSTSWTPGTELINQIINSSSGACKITTKTYNGTTLIGTKEVSLTLTVPADVVPTIDSIVLTDPKGFKDTYLDFVQGKSQLMVTVNASGVYSSTISAYQITALGNTATTNPWTSNVISESGTMSVSVTVTDSRGRTATQTASFNVLAYELPTITKLTNSRCNADGTANDEGAYVNIAFSGSVSPLNNRNNKSFIVRYKSQDSESWTVATTITNVYSVNTNVIVPANVDKPYDTSFVVTDAFSSSERTDQLSTAFTLMDFNKSGKGMSIGKVSEGDVFEVAMETKFPTVIDEDGVVGESEQVINEQSLKRYDSSLGEMARKDPSEFIDSSNLKVVYSVASSKSIASATWTKMVETTLNKGRYIMFAHLSLSGTSAGIMGGYVRSSQVSDGNLGNQPIGSQNTRCILNFSGYREITEDNTPQMFYGYQRTDSSAGSHTTYYRLVIIKIGDL